MSSARPGSRWVLAGVVTSSVAAVALMLPWVMVGRRRFSSLDLISSASALEIIDGGRKQAVIAAWMAIPVLVASAYVLAATGRRRWLAGTLLPLGPMYVVAVLAISANTPLRSEWGLHVGLLAGVCSSVVAVVLLVQAQAEPG